MTDSKGCTRTSLEFCVGVQLYRPTGFRGFTRARGSLFEIMRSVIGRWAKGGAEQGNFEKMDYKMVKLYDPVLSRYFCNLFYNISRGIFDFVCEIKIQ